MTDIVIKDIMNWHCASEMNISFMIIAKLCLLTRTTRLKKTFKQFDFCSNVFDSEEKNEIDGI